jgi:hypothetical protein
MQLIPALLAGGLQSLRHLQQFTIPDYTSPPLDIAIEATPELFRDDAYLNKTRDMIGSDGSCNDDITGCQILFPPAPEAVESGTAKLGVLFYGGGLVDPRSYSIIAKKLSDVHGLAVAIPIFTSDLAYSDCSGTNRLSLAASAFPDVEKWILAGHSLGGIGAQVDLWNARNETDSDVGGLVLMGSYIRQDLGCGAIDFSQTNIPMASVSGELDGIVNRTRFDLGQEFLSTNDTFLLDVMGGNHGYFGHYNYTLRTPILGQNDGDALIPREIQIDLSIGAIMHVASRMGLPLPSFTKRDVAPKIISACEDKILDTSTSSSGIFWHGFSGMTIALATFLFTYCW